MEAQNIKDVLVFVNESKTKLISLQKTDENSYNLIINRIHKRTIEPHEREKINTAKGTWHFTADENGLVYGVLTSNDYSERLVYQMIYELILELKKFNNIKSEDPEKINKFCNTAVKQLASKYESPENLNKINEAMNQIEDTRLIVEQNLKKVVDNTANLDEVGNKADQLKQNAQQFYKGSKDLARLMYMRNLKVNIVIGLVIVSVLLYILVPIIAQ